MDHHHHHFDHNHNHNHNNQHDYYKQQLIDDELERMSAIEAALVTACELRDRYAVLLERAESSKITDFSAIIRVEEEEMGEDNNDYNDISSRAVMTLKEKERSLMRKWRAEYRELTDIRLPRLRLQHNRVHASLIRLVAGDGAEVEP